MAGLMWTHWRCRDLSYLNAARPRPSIRQDEKQGRESGHGGVVRVFAEDGYIVARLDRSSDSEQIRRLLAAPNAVPVRKHAGELVGIRLLSLGDDRGHAGERHGRSTITTERVRNDHGVYIGGNRTLKHKLEKLLNYGCPEMTKGGGREPGGGGDGRGHDEGGGRGGPGGIKRRSCGSGGAPINAGILDAGTRRSGPRCPWDNIRVPASRRAGERATVRAPLAHVALQKQRAARSTSVASVRQRGALGRELARTSGRSPSSQVWLCSGRLHIGRGGHRRGQCGPLRSRWRVARYRRSVDFVLWPTLCRR